MKIEDLNTTVLAGSMPVRQAVIEADQLQPACREVKDEGGRLVALWGSDEREQGQGFMLHVALADRAGLLCLHLPCDHQFPVYPDISAIFPAASRMQRANHDLLGMAALNTLDQRPWLRHAAWPEDLFPLRKEFGLHAQYANEPDNYPFVSVSGDGVHEIPVGPVHAGTIEPGHFRFSIVGERVLRLEERLGYKHKGIEKRFESLNLEEGARLAGRISGDSTVAYAWAYAMALEGMTGCTPPVRAQRLRALFLERERLANHLGDLGFLGNDAAFSFGLSKFLCLKEEVLRLNAQLFGHRYLMDCIVPGGCSADIDSPGIEAILVEANRLETEIKTLRNIYEEHAGLQDRFLTTGRVTPSLAAQLGLTGMAGRASGQAWDLRAQFPCAPYDRLEVRMSTHRNGDVAARVVVRFEEALESLRLTRMLLAGLPVTDVCIPVPAARAGAFGIGWVEGWRGEVLIALTAGADNGIRRCHPHDPSWQNWPVLEHAILGNIVPDFPLINKSFNLSYSGQDL